MQKSGKRIRAGKVQVKMKVQIYSNIDVKGHADAGTDVGADIDADANGDDGANVAGDAATDKADQANDNMENSNELLLVLSSLMFNVGYAHDFT